MRQKEKEEREKNWGTIEQFIEINNDENKKIPKRKEALL